MCCKLCLQVEDEYFGVHSEFKAKILKLLNLKILQDAIICKLCVEKIELFDEFYQQTHLNQLKDKVNHHSSAFKIPELNITESHYDTDNSIQVPSDNNGIRYIILLDDNETKLELKRVDDIEVETTESDSLTLNTEPVTLTSDNLGIRRSKRRQIINEKLSEVAEDDLEVDDDPPDEILDEQYYLDEMEVKMDDVDDSVGMKLEPMNLDGFPKELIKDSKIIIRGKELSKLISKFYCLECDLCSSGKGKFKKLSTFIQHYKTEHQMKGYVTCCSTKFVKLRGMALHMALHIQPEAFQCTICKKYLTCPKILQYHMQNHLPESERPLKCMEHGCERRFSYQSALNTHTISHLPENERTTFVCSIVECNKKFSSAGRLSTHVNTAHNKHHNEFVCQKCGKSFSCKSNLSYHLTTHQPHQHQVQCPECQKWLKNILCLRKHMSLHKNVRHFCGICDYSAVNKQCLRNHVRVQHSDSKPFQCSVCSRNFKLKNTLVNHMAQHSGIRKFQCEFCEKKFASSGNYYSHRKRMHPQELSKMLREKETEEHKQRTAAQKKKNVVNHKI
ncbi:unnamed protein product [Diamesa tonsa]